MPIKFRKNYSLYGCVNDNIGNIINMTNENFSFVKCV